MKIVYLFDVITFSCSVVGIAVVALGAKRKISRDIRFFITSIFALMIAYSLSLFVEWSGITLKLDPYEDMMGAVIPLLWAFLFYSLIQIVSSRVIKESEQRLHLALKGTLAGLWDWDINGGFFIINERWAEVLGYSKAELEPVSKHKWEALIYLDDLENYNSLLGKHLSGECEYFEAEFRLTHKSGSCIWVRDSGMVVERDSDDKPLRMVGTLVEITQQKLAVIDLTTQMNKNKNLYEEYLCQNEELSESLIHIRTINEELSIAKKKAEEADKLKSAFLANMSHEIRTPMNGILGFSNRLSTHGLSVEKRDHFIQIINNCGQQLLSIIDDLIDIAKIESNQLKINLLPCDINLVVREIFSILQSRTKQGVHLSYHTALDDGNAVVLTDCMRLRQVIINLVSNAQKFTHSGYVRFGYELSGDSNIMFFVSDSGIGIAPDKRDLIFDRFRQADDSTAQYYGGSGLGLAISKALVQLLDGDIGVESVEGKGSKFFFTIPLRKATCVPEIEKESFKHIIPNSITKVLVADDDDTNLFYLEELLTDINLTILKAKNGIQAVEVFKENPDICLVLMDLKMPFMSGFDATRAIKTIAPSVTVIAQTAYALSPDRDAALAVGCDDYIAKPVNQEALYAIISKYIA